METIAESNLEVILVGEIAKHVPQPVNFFLRSGVLSLGIHDCHKNKNNVLEVHLDLLSQELSSLLDVQVGFHIGHDSLPLLKLIIHLIKLCVELIFGLLLRGDTLHYTLGQRIPGLVLDIVILFGILATGLLTDALRIVEIFILLKVFVFSLIPERQSGSDKLLKSTDTMRFSSQLTHEEL